MPVPGGFDIENRGDAVGTAGKGIFVDLSDDQTGAVTLVLNNVTVSGVASHGVHVSDCDLADDCGGGGGGAGGGSDGSIVVHATGLTIDDAGNGTFDADGLRVDEAGEGSIIALIIGSEISGNFDEGLDIDEEGAGGIELTLVGTSASGNSDGAHKNSEEDDGSVTALVVDTGATDNGGVGMVFEEEDGGDVNVTAMGLSTSGSDDGELGLEVVQDDDGAGNLSLSGSEIADGVEAEGVEMSEMQAAPPRPARRPRPRRGLLHGAQARSNGLGSRGFETA